MARLREPRLTPLKLEDVDGETRELLEKGAEAMGGRILNIFGTLARHPKLYKRWSLFGNQILFRSTLAPRDRELAILRIGWRCAAEYEWGQHVLIGKRDGLDDDDVRRIADGPDATGWTPLESAILQATDELHDDSHVSKRHLGGFEERAERKAVHRPDLYRRPVHVGFHGAQFARRTA